MDRDKLIRRATSHLKDEARANAVQFFCKHPHLLKTFMPRVREDMKKPYKVRPKRQKGLVNFSLWLSPDEYIVLRERAQHCKMSMAEFIRATCDLTKP